MRILAYFFLLVLLLFTAASIFVLTQSGQFEATQNKTIAFQKNVVFNYVNDYANWNAFISLHTIASTPTAQQSEISLGEGAFSTWDDVSWRTTKTVANESIFQDCKWKNTALNSEWFFEQKQDSTLVRWNIKGKLGFKERLFQLVGLGSFTTLEKEMGQTLTQLNQVLRDELNRYNIRIDGVVQVPNFTYLQQKKNVTKIDFYSQMPNYLAATSSFFTTYNLEMTGSPLCFFEGAPTNKKEMQIKMCYPIKQEIFTSPESEISYDVTQPFKAVKATLIGDYSHLDSAWKALVAHCKKNNIQINQSKYHLEVYVKNYLQSNQPSQWVTELYFPIQTVNTIVESK